MLENFQDTGDSSTEDLIKSILHSAPYGIMTFRSVRNSDGKIIDFEWLLVNDVAAKILNNSVEELVGKQLLTVVPASVELGIFDKYCNVVENGTYLTFEQTYQEEEEELWFRISAIKLGDGLTVTFLNISDLKNAIQEITVRERKYRKLFQGSLDPIFIINDEWELIDANDAFLTHFDVSISKLDELRFNHLFKKPTSYDSFTHELFEKESVSEFEAELLSGKGNEKLCSINCTLIKDDSEESRLYQGVIRDISKKRKIERDILLAEKLSMTGKIARSIAHEIRNPLTNLNLALEQLKDEIPEEVEDAELYFNIIQRNSNRIGKLIGELLDSSKPKEPQLKPQSINGVLKDALELVADRFKLQSMKIEEKFDQQLPPIPLDADLLKVALLNLFINAVEAMRIAEGILKVNTCQENSDIVVIIEDNGKGITEENLDKLFEPFFTAKNEGMGLGLTTVQNIIRSHLANIDVSSKLGEGTRFTITFPIPSV